LSQLQVGDRAVITSDYSGFGGEGLEPGNVVQITDVDRHLRFPGSEFQFAAVNPSAPNEAYDLFMAHELRPLQEFIAPVEGPTTGLIDPEYVHIIESRQIWVTLPGDTAGHKLSEDQARTLFHQLEEIL